MIFPYLNQLHFSAPKLKISHSSPYHCHPFSLPLSKTFSPTEPFAIPGQTLVQEAYFVVAYLHILSHFPHWKVDPRLPFLTVTNRMWLKWCYLTSVSRSESVLYLPPESLGVHSQWETIYYVGNSATCEIHITDRLHGGSRLTAPAELQANNQHKVPVMRVSCFDCPAQSHLKVTGHDQDVIATLREKLSH